MSEPGEAQAEGTAGNGVATKDTLLPEGVLRVRLGPGANCSSAGSAIDVLFYGSVIVGALAVALAAAFPPKPPGKDDDASGDDAGGEGAPHEAPR